MSMLARALLLLLSPGALALCYPRPVARTSGRRALLRSSNAVAISRGLRRLMPFLAGEMFAANAAPIPSARDRIVNGMHQRSLGSSGILVSQLALGTQRWGSTDFNAPDEAACHQMLDIARANGVNFIDTAEQYPIPSDRQHPEGLTEQIIGSWLAKDKTRRKDLVIASKITGGRNVTPRNIEADLQGTLKRLGTDYLDIYLLHWPARYTPQANWGQSLEYNYQIGASSRQGASFEQIAGTMGKLVSDGVIRGWGMCNDNAYGLMGSIMAARLLGVTPPCVMQNDYSLINRRIEENGVSEASAPWNEDVGFMAYNTLAGGMLTGKYLDVPAAADDADRARALANAKQPRGRMDELGWGRTLYRYRSGPAQEATRAYAKLAMEAGMSLTELSLRWTRSRPACTSVLLGTSSVNQLKQDVKFFTDDKELPADLLWEIDRIHMRNRLPIFASTRVGKDWYGEGEIGEPIP